MTLFNAVGVQACARAVGERLLSSRRLQNLSREDLALLAGVSISFIRDAEQTTERCSLGKLLQLMQALGLDWSALAQGDADEVKGADAAPNKQDGAAAS